MTKIAEPTLFPTEDFAMGGMIGRITPDRCSAVVRLDHAVAGKELAIISFDTRGRVELMNKKCFDVGARVKILELREGPDGHFVAQVAPG